jgi:hypothetical protein
MSREVEMQKLRDMLRDLNALVKKFLKDLRAKILR